MAPVSSQGSGTSKGSPADSLRDSAAFFVRYLDPVPYFVSADGGWHNMMYISIEFARFLRKRCLIKIFHAFGAPGDHVYPLRRTPPSGLADHRRQCRLPCLTRTANNDG